jgi:hypothetical protein
MAKDHLRATVSDNKRALERALRQAVLQNAVTAGRLLATLTALGPDRPRGTRWGALGPHRSQRAPSLSQPTLASRSARWTPRRFAEETQPLNSSREISWLGHRSPHCFQGYRRSEATVPTKALGKSPRVFQAWRSRTLRSRCRCGGGGMSTASLTGLATRLPTLVIGTPRSASSCVA